MDYFDSAVHRLHPNAGMSDARSTIVLNVPLSLEPDELEFFKAQTGLEENELKDHIADVQTKALQVYPYFCIKHFAFIKFVFFVIHTRDASNHVRQA